MLIGGVVHHQVDDHPNSTLLSAVRELDEVAERAVTRIDVVIVGHIVAVVTGGGSLERHQPDGRYSQPVQVVQSAHEARKIPDSIPVGIHVSAHG